MQHTVDSVALAPASATPLLAQQSILPLIAQDQAGVGLDQQPGRFLGPGPGVEPLRVHQWQEVRLAIALDPLLRVCRPEQFAPARHPR